MPSKPRADWNIVDTDRENSSAAELTDDLLAVAEQLTDDANYLAARYPVTAVQSRLAQATEMPGETWGEAAPSPQRRLWQHAVAALLFFALGSGATVLALHRWGPANSVPTSALSMAPSNSEHSLTSPTPASKTVAAGSPQENAVFGVHEVGLNPATSPHDALSEVEMLRIQTQAFEQVIRKLQDELSRRDKQQAELQQTVESLREEVTALRQKVGETQHSEARSTDPQKK